MGSACTRCICYMGTPLHCLAASGPICSTQPITSLVHRATSPSGKVVRLGA